MYDVFNYSWLVGAPSAGGSGVGCSDSLPARKYGVWVPLLRPHVVSIGDNQ